MTMVHREGKFVNEITGLFVIIADVYLLSIYSSGMDLLTWPNVTLEQFQDLLPELKHLEPSLRERVMIEGNLTCTE